MSTRKSKKKPFDILTELANFGLEQQVSLSDSLTFEKFLNHVSEETQRILSDPLLLHGQRTEAMFEALVVCLGKFKLFKKEDIGTVFPEGKYIAPDFRVILEDDRQLLIEVKNVYEHNPGKRKKSLMNSDYHRKMDAYAKVTGAELKLAIYWARWRLWTLVTPGNFLDKGGNLALDLPQAIKANELISLGDMMIGTKPPLRLQLIAEPSTMELVGDDGFTTFTVGDTKIYCGEDEIIDPVEREIAWTIILYGGWEESEPKIEVDMGKLRMIEYSWEPEERESSGFGIVGFLSQMFAQYYTDLTIKSEKVVQIRAPFQPGWFEPLVREDLLCDKLPLARFLVRPSLTKID